MKEFKNIEKLIRDSLVDYKPTPSPTSKERFLSHASGMKIGSMTSIINIRNTIIAIVALVLMAGLTYFGFFKKDYSNEEHNTESTTTQFENTSQERIKESVTNINSGKPENASQINKSKNSESEVIKRNNNNDISGKRIIKEWVDNTNRYEISPISDEPVYTIKRVEIPILIAAKGNEVYNFYEYRKSNSSLLIKADNVEVFEAILNDQVKKQPKTNGSKNLNLAYSVYYRPELIFNIIESNKLTHNVGADIHFKFFNDKYILRTGLGASFSKGYYQYSVDYNEYMGSYQGLDSISFNLGENNFDLIPTYHKSDREVFDTIIKSETSTIDKRHTYLQVPIILGYDFFTNKKYSLGIRFGPVLSIHVSSKDLSSEYNPGKDRIIQLNQITPDRINTNWSLMAGFNVNLYTKKILFFEFEPQFSYFFNSVYEKYDPAKSPYSIGFRIGIGIK